MTDATETSSLHLQLADLRASGAGQADPVRFRYLEALAQRLNSKGLQNTRHWQKLEQAVASYQIRYQKADQLPITTKSRHPSPLSELLDQISQSQSVQTTAPRSKLEQEIFGMPEEHTGAAPSASTPDTPSP